MDRQVAILRPVNAINEFNEPETTWQLVDMVWAAKIPQRGSERFAAAQVAGHMVTTFKIRWRDDLSPLDRLEYQGRQWDIYDVRELGRRDGLEIDAVAYAA